MAEISFVLLLVFLSPLAAKPGAKPLAKSDPGHLVHDFYKCTSPVYRLSPECQQPAPRFASGRIFSESQHFVEGGGGSQNPHQAAQNNWPSYGGNTGEKKNERMVMPAAVEEESSTRRIHEDVQTTTSVVDANHTVEEERINTVETVELGDISQQDQMDLVQQSYQRVQSVNASVYDETTMKNQDSTQQVGLEVNDTEGNNSEEDTTEEDTTDEDNVEEDNVGQLFMDIRNRTAAADLTDGQEQESSVWPSASYTSILLTPSIAHLPLENQEVTLTQGQLQLENKDYMLEQNEIHLQPESHMEVEEEMVDLSGPLPEKDFAEEESPSVYDPIILMLQRP